MAIEARIRLVKEMVRILRFYLFRLAVALFRIREGIGKGKVDVQKRTGAI